MYMMLEMFLRRVGRILSVCVCFMLAGSPSAGSSSSSSLSNASSSLQQQLDSIAAGPTCPVCKATFVQPLEMLHHMRREHLGVRRRYDTLLVYV